MVKKPANPLVDQIVNLTFDGAKGKGKLDKATLKELATLYDNGKLSNTNKVVAILRGCEEGDK